MESCKAFLKSEEKGGPINFLNFQVGEPFTLKIVQQRWFKVKSNAAQNKVESGRVIFVKKRLIF